MKKLIVLLLLTFNTLYSTNAQSRKKIKITGEVTFTGLYKGGARPTEEMLQKCCTPKAWSNKKLYLKKNYYSKALYTLQTDSSGKFKSCVREGVYNLYMNNEINDSLSSELENQKDNEEMQWLTNPYAVIEVKKKGDRFFDIQLKERRNNEIPPP
jgi:hypothetical protein